MPQLAYIDSFNGQCRPPRWSHQSPNLVLDPGRGPWRSRRQKITTRGRPSYSGKHHGRIGYTEGAVRGCTALYNGHLSFNNQPQQPFFTNKRPNNANGMTLPPGAPESFCVWEDLLPSRGRLAKTTSAHRSAIIASRCFSPLSTSGSLEKSPIPPEDRG